MDYLNKVFRELIRLGFSYENIMDFTDFPRNKLVHELINSHDEWNRGIVALLDINNWNLQNLILDEPRRYIGGGDLFYETHLRKPKAFFSLFITQKGNLSLDWSPWAPDQLRISLDGTDWLHWKNEWPVGGTLPFNRVMMIREFQYILYHKKPSYQDLDGYILQTIKEIIDKIYWFLGRFIEIHKVTDLYLTQQGGYNSRQPVEWQILDVKEAKAAEEKAERERYISSFCNEFETTPEKVLRCFKEN